MASQPFNASDRAMQSYLKTMSSVYSRQTGNSSQTVALQYLSRLPSSILSPDAVIYDNACGPGTATSIILGLTRTDPPRKIEATDNAEPMINELRSKITHFTSQKSEDSHPAAEAWSIVNPQILDSHALPFQDDSITFSITNCSVSTFSDPEKCLREIHRTLSPHRPSMAVVSTWKYFGVAEVIRSAQRSIKGPDTQVMPLPKPEYFEEGHLEKKMIEAGFSDVRVEVESTVLKEENLEGVREFMTSDFVKPMQKDWTDEEKGRWKGESDRFVGDEVKKRGGVLMEAWFVSGRK